MLGGTWDVAPAIGYTPPAGQTYTVVRTYDPGSARTGTFAAWWVYALRTSSTAPM